MATQEDKTKENKAVRKTTGLNTEFVSPERPAAMKPFLQWMKERWVEHSAAEAAPENPVPAALAANVRELCEVLLDLINEDAYLTRTQQILIEHAILYAAMEGDPVREGHALALDTATVAALPIATYINSCQRPLNKR